MNPWAPEATARAHRRPANDNGSPAASPARATVFEHGGSEYVVVSVPIEDAKGDLTQAERALLPLLRRGLSNEEMGVLRGVSHRTVANQVSRLLRKLSARSRRALAR